MKEEPNETPCPLVDTARFTSHISSSTGMYSNCCSALNETEGDIPYTEDVTQKDRTPVEMSHALPKRIARMQQKLQPNHHTVCRKWKNGTPILKHIPVSTNLSLLIPKSADSNEKISDSEQLKQHNSKILDPSENSSSMEGLFGWTLIDQTYVPYIFRADNKQYVCVKIIEQKVLNKYPNTFPEELAIREPLSSSIIQPSERKVFNNLLQMQNKDNTTLVIEQNDVVVLLSEFLSFYNVVKKIFPECVKSEKQLSKQSPLRKSGWLQINNTVIPFISRANEKFLPLAVLKHAASIDIETEGILPFDEECNELNIRCAEEGFHFIFKASTRLVSLVDIKNLGSIQIIELPQKNPLQYAQYMITDEPNGDGMKISTHDVQHRILKQSDQAMIQTSFTKERINSELKRDSEVTTNEKECPEGKPGSSTVITAPHTTQHVFIPTWHTPYPVQRNSVIHQIVDPYRIMHHKDNGQYTFCGHSGIFSFNVNQEHFTNKYGPVAMNTNGNRQVAIPTQIMSTLPPGQNINLNYGINIQNINPYNDFLHHKRQVSNVLHNEIPQNSNIRQQLKRMAVTSNPQKFQQTTPTNIPMPQQATVIGCSDHKETSTTPSMNMLSFNNTVEKQQANPVLINNRDESTYRMKQRRAIQDIKGRIKSVWIGDKNISCLQLNFPGRTGRFSLVEAICKLYFRNRTVSEFLFTIDKTLETITCTEFEEQAFIEYYQLPVKVLRCNKMLELSAFEKIFPELVQILGDGSQKCQNSTNNRCQPTILYRERSNTSATTFGTIDNDQRTTDINVNKGNLDLVSC